MALELVRILDPLVPRSDRLLSYNADPTNYLLNGMFTFRDQQGSRLGWRRFARFAVAWVVLTAASTLAMQGVQAHAGLQWAWLAKPFVEVLLAGISFLAYRHWIYK